MRSTLLAVALVVGILPLGATAAMAHGSDSDVQLAITGGDGQTTVRAFVTYVDADPVVHERVELRASSGTRHTTTVMQPVPQSAGTYLAHLNLTPGRWQLGASAEILTRGAATATLLVASDGSVSDVHRTSTIGATDADVSTSRPLKPLLATLLGMLLAAGILVMSVGAVRGRKDQEVGS